MLPGNQGTPRLGLNLARVWPNLGSLAYTGRLGRCWERSRSPTLARSCGALDKQVLSANPAALAPWPPTEALRRPRPFGPPWLADLPRLRRIQKRTLTGLARLRYSGRVVWTLLDDLGACLRTPNERSVPGWVGSDERNYQPRL